MLRKDFALRTRDRFAEKYHKQISCKNILQILDAMRDVVIEALKTDREFLLRNIIELKIKEPYVRQGFNSFKKETQIMRVGLKIRAKIAQAFIDDVADK